MIRFIEKFGLAASCINTLFGLYFLRYFKAIREESDLSFPPFIAITDLGADEGTDAGSVYIYKYNGTDEWIEQNELFASDAAVDDRFGQSVEINDNYVLIGANYKDYDSLDKAGAAYIFKKDDGAESWTQQTKLLANDGDELERFGTDVQLSDDYALVSAPRNDTNQGAVYEFQMSELSVSAGVCFLGNTLVLTDQGKIPIKRITDIISSLNESSLMFLFK